MQEAIQDITVTPVNICVPRQSLEKRLFYDSGIPPEIWLLVFSNLKSSDLRAVSSVCKPFRYMAQPLLFSVLDISPFLFSYNTDKPILRHQSYLSRLTARLECYKQPHIAPGVHHCWVSPYTIGSGFPPRNSQDGLDPNSIINTLFESLPSFPSLTTLSWHCIDITPNWWSVIQSLNIRNLWLNSSSIPTFQTPLTSVVHLDLDNWPWRGKTTNHVSMHEERGHGIEQSTLNHVIHPDVILSISVPRLDTACYVFSVLSQTDSWQLRVLRIPFFSISDPKFIPALRMCPRLEVLCIFPPITDTLVQDVVLDTIPLTYLPYLRSYEGPCTHLLNICRQPLEHVSLWGFHERLALCDPDALAETLNNFAQQKSIESLRSLTVLVVGITFDLLQSFSAFEYLERLTVQSQEREFPTNERLSPRFYISALYDMIGTIVLPSTLRSIKLITRLNSDQDVPVQEHQVASFIQAFATQYPKVQRIYISYGIYWTGTYTAKWGRILQTNDDNLIQNEGDSSQSESGKVDEGDGYSAKSSSTDCLASTVISSVNLLPLGKLTFTEHRRTILFQSGSPMYPDSVSGLNEHMSWMTNFWMRLRRFFGGKNPA